MCQLGFICSSSISTVYCAHCNDRDLSYWGFEQLAHPLNGIMTTLFRPVDCYTKQPLTFQPGYVNQTIYGDRAESGWSWSVYKQNTDRFAAPVSWFSLHILLLDLDAACIKIEVSMWLHIKMCTSKDCCSLSLPL